MVNKMAKYYMEVNGMEDYRQACRQVEILRENYNFNITEVKNDDGNVVAILLEEY